jgi:hypothetical protein
MTSFTITKFNSMDGYKQHTSGLLVPENHKPYPIAVDLFCGCGGFSLGFIKAGFQVIAGFDNDPWAAQTYMCNLGSYPIQIHYTSDKYKEELAEHFEKQFKKQKKKREKEGRGQKRREKGEKRKKRRRAIYLCTSWQKESKSSP